MRVLDSVQERRMLIEKCQEISAAQCIRISFLSGDVHVCAAGRLYSDPKVKTLFSMPKYFFLTVMHGTFILFLHTFKIQTTKGEFADPAAQLCSGVQQGGRYVSISLPFLVLLCIKPCIYVFGNQLAAWSVLCDIAGMSGQPHVIAAFQR